MREFGERRLSSKDRRLETDDEQESEIEFDNYPVEETAGLLNRIVILQTVAASSDVAKESNPFKQINLSGNSNFKNGFNIEEALENTYVEKKPESIFDFFKSKSQGLLKLFKNKSEDNKAIQEVNEIKFDDEKIDK